MEKKRLYEITVKHEDGEIATYFTEAQTAQEARENHFACNYGTKIIRIKWLR